MDAIPLLHLRLRLGKDVRHALEVAVLNQGCDAGLVVAGIGSLDCATLRLAGVAEVLKLGRGAGSADPGEQLGCEWLARLHAPLADAQGGVLGGHLGYGCRVRTTAEVLLALLPDWQFLRKPDAATGYGELALRRRLGPPD